MTRTETHNFHLLGLSGAETLGEVKRAYRQLARRLHPDRASGDSERFKEITAAYNQIQLSFKSGRKCVDSQTRVRPAPWTTRSHSSNQRARTAAWGQASGPKRRARRYAEESGDAQKPAEPKQSRQNYGSYDDRNVSGDSTQRSKKAHPGTAGQTHKRGEYTTQAPQTSAAQKAEASNRPQESDIEAAWKEWCEKTKGYQASRTSETAETRVEFESTETVSQGETPDDRRGIRGWIRRGINRLGLSARGEAVGRDTHLRLQVSSHLVVHGGQQRIAVHRHAKCPSCTENQILDCVCGGLGRIKVREVVNVNLAPGATVGAQIRVTGKGDESLHSGLNGDLILTLEPMGVEGFRREGIHLHGRLDLDHSMLQSGGMVDVSLPRGRVKLKVPSRTRVGDRFRLKNQGLDQWCGIGRGDVYLTVRVA